MGTNRGVALILALLVLSFLTVLGSALLTTSTIDIWISDNYKGATQSLYLAEAGIDHARQSVRSSAASLTDLLIGAAGPDVQLMTADDVPLISRRAIGSAAGTYEVWLRNDAADGMSALADLNDVVTLISVGQVGSSRKTMEVTIQKGRFPETDADPRLYGVRSLEHLVDAIIRNATDVYSGTVLNAVGGPADYRVVVVDGNLELGPGAGYGLLLVRGELDVVGPFTWNGLILVIGQGVHRSTGAVTVNGGLFVARTRAPNGALLTTPENVAFTITDSAQMKAANRTFPYNPIAIREK